LCIVHDVENNEYHRGLIKNIKPTATELVLIDYGTYFTCTDKELYKMSINSYKIQRLAISVYLNGVVLPEVGSAGADQCIEYIQTVLCEQDSIFLSNIDEDVVNDS